MSAWDLPTSLHIGGVDFAIRTDYRAIIDILSAFMNPEYEDDEKAIIALTIFYEDFEDMPVELWEDAMDAMNDFIDSGIPQDGAKKPRTMDWEQDAPIIIPAVNKVLGQEVRAIPYMHWWTFLGAYMEIGESTFASVVSIRTKKAKGERLEKWEKDYYRDNKGLIDLKTKLTEEEQAEKDRLEQLLR